ncbi:RNase H domain-containing protein [Trichonephila clavipes]|nr:RNase H domain-containing protein [Trichonephila clavipes]
MHGHTLFRENLSASSISNYDCILSPFFIPHPSERNAINIVQFSDKSTDFPVICYTDGSKIDGRVGFAFVVFRSGVESENFQFRIRDECTVFVAELLCLNFAVKWITEQNSVISEYLICTDSLSSLDSLKCISSSDNIIVEIQKQLKSLRDKKISIDFAFVRGHTGVLGNERADWLAKAATKRKIDIDGDSGGPLQCRLGDKFFVFGAASFVTTTNFMSGLCTGPGAMTVYANSADKADWIKTIISKYS